MEQMILLTNTMIAVSDRMCFNRITRTSILVSSSVCAQCNVSVVFPAECHPLQFTCARNKKCIPYDYYCDGDDDCEDGSNGSVGSDEIDCPQSCNNSTMVVDVYSSCCEQNI